MPSNDWSTWNTPIPAALLVALLVGCSTTNLDGATSTSAGGADVGVGTGGDTNQGARVGSRVEAVEPEEPSEVEEVREDQVLTFE
ncbi:MAG: hypothetical protein ACFCBW_08070 [Candidatus Competibacterales bacterium]